MTKYIVKTPVKGYNGMRAGVMFGAGKAEVDDTDPKHAKALAYFERKGYTVKEVEEAPADNDPGDGEAIARPAQSASKNDWAVYVGVKYADEVKPEEAADMTKAQLQSYVREREPEATEPDTSEPEGDEE